MLTAVTMTHPGVVRPNNEDAVVWDPVLGLLAVADGMGGHNAGEVASRMALDALRQSLAETVDRTPAAWPFGYDDAAPVPANRLRTAVQAANRAVYRASLENPDYSGMGTTITAALIHGAEVWFANVGDSRLYVKPIGQSALRQLTRDDSFAAKLADLPGVQPLALTSHPMRHLLTNVLGPKDNVVVSIGHVMLNDREILIVTTDGMHGPVGDAVMEAVLDGHEHGLDLQVAAENLLAVALDAGGRDNITIAIARYVADEKAPPIALESAAKIPRA